MKKTTKTGMIGALLDEYLLSIEDLISHLHDVSDEELVKIADSETANKYCVSIQSVLSHVVDCALYYIVVIDEKRDSKLLTDREMPWYPTTAAYISSLESMYEESRVFLEQVHNSEMRRYTNEEKIKTNWGQYYDFEQMMEHAIVHIYRHRRQIQLFKSKLRS